MSKVKSPGAVAAHGASETDRLSGKVVSNDTLSQNCSQAIRATLVGSDICTAVGMTARSFAPVFALCRKLVSAGHDPATSLEVWRGDILGLRLRAIGAGARLTVEDDQHGRPRLRLWRDRGRGAGQHVAQIDEMPLLATRALMNDELTRGEF